MVNIFLEQAKENMHPHLHFPKDEYEAAPSTKSTSSSIASWMEKPIEKEILLFKKKTPPSVAERSN